VSNIAVVLAGGVGYRFKSDQPKQFAKLAGKPVIIHTLENLHLSELIDQIYVVMNPEFITEFEDMLQNYKIDYVQDIIAGGKDRNESTQNALNYFNSNDFADDTNLFMHDAVRPFVTEGIIQRCNEALESFNAVDTAIPANDTIIQVDDDDNIEEIPTRKYLRQGQTPQCFKLETLTKAYERANEDKDFATTDDCSVVLKYLPNEKIKVVAGNGANIKITEPLDLQLADKLFQLRSAHAKEFSDLRLKDYYQNKKILILGGGGIAQGLQDLMESLGGQVRNYSLEDGLDITDGKNVEKFVSQANEEMGGIDIVVATAGILTIKPIHDFSFEEIDKNIQVNYVGNAIIAKVVYPYLKKSKGSLIFFASSSYTRGRENYSLYSSSKAAIVNLAQALAEEWASDEISVNTIVPQRTLTPMRTNAFGEEPEGTLLTVDKVATETFKAIASGYSGQIFDITL